MKGSDEELVAAARVLKVWGLRGAVKLAPYFEIVRLLREGETVVVRTQRGDPLLMQLIEVRQGGGHLFVRFAERSAPEEVRDLVGGEVWLPRSMLAELEEGEFYWHQVEGLAVEDTEGRFLGRVVEILSTPGHDLFVIRDERREFLLPAVKAFVLEIDPEGGKMVVSPPEGLVEETVRAV